MRETDLDQLYAYHLDIDNRGDYFPRGVLAQPAFQKQFQETGFWGKEEGMLVMVSPKDEILGHIEFFKTVNYLDEYELSYQVYAPEQRGKGVATEAVNLLVGYLFETKQLIGSGWSFIRIISLPADWQRNAVSGTKAPRAERGITRAGIRMLRSTRSCMRR